MIFVRMYAGVIKLLKSGYRYLRSFFIPENANEHRLCYQLLSEEKSPGVMFDIGAHHGDVLAPFASDGWKVYAFEPDDENRRKLTSRYQSQPDVIIDPRAVAEKSRKIAPLYRSEESSGLSTLAPFRESHSAVGEVEVISIEDFLMKNNLMDLEIDFLKVDTEGFDLFVLQGIPWDRVMPRLILCEFEDSKTQKLDYNFQDLAEFLVEKNYQLIISEWYPIQRYGTTHQWRRFCTYPCSLQDPDGWGNIIASRDSKHYRKMLEYCGLSES